MCHDLIALAKDSTDRSDSYVSRIKQHIQTLTTAVSRGRPRDIILSQAEEYRSVEEWKFIDCVLYLFLHFLQFISDQKDAVWSIFPEFRPGHNNWLDRKELSKCFKYISKTSDLENH